MYERILKKVETAVKTVKDSQENSEDAQAQAREVPITHNQTQPPPTLAFVPSNNILKSHLRGTYSVYFNFAPVCLIKTY